MSRDYNILVNKEHPLPKNYKIDDLVDVKGEKDFFLPMKISAVVYDAFLRLSKDQAVKGFNLCINSGYRSYQMQQAIWHTYRIKRGPEYTKNFVAVPGTSEHHTGLAIDIVKKIGGRNVNLTPDEYKILREVAPEYGLIMRYPEGKKDITGVGYEPWHFRYLTKDAIDTMLDENLTLEEYTEKARKR